MLGKCLEEYVEKITENDLKIWNPLSLSHSPFFGFISIGIIIDHESCSVQTLVWFLFIMAAKHQKFGWISQFRFKTDLGLQVSRASQQLLTMFVNKLNHWQIKSVIKCGNNKPWFSSTN